MTQIQNLLIVMVVLPARDKSYVSKKPCRYLNCLQHDTAIFNVGNRRRNDVAQESTPSSSYSQVAHFFDSENVEANKLRERFAMETLDEGLEHLIKGGGPVALFHAANSTVERRNAIVQRIRQRSSKLQILFLESQCFDADLIESNMRLKLSGPDYKAKYPVTALEDFRQPVAMYEKKYIPLGENGERNGLSYCQMVEVGRKFIMHRIHSFYAFEAVHYLQQFDLLPRQIWLTRHGQSYDDLTSRIGGDAELTASGIRYALTLSRFIDHQREEWQWHCQRPETKEFEYSYNESPNNFQVWSSTTRRSRETAQFFSTLNYDTNQLPMLDELNAGILDGLEREEVKEYYSDWYEKR